MSTCVLSQKRISPRWSLFTRPSTSWLDLPSMRRIYCCPTALNRLAVVISKLLLLLQNVRKLHEINKLCSLPFSYDLGCFLYKCADNLVSSLLKLSMRSLSVCCLVAFVKSSQGSRKMRGNLTLLFQLVLLSHVKIGDEIYYRRCATVLFSFYGFFFLFLQRHIYWWVTAVNLLSEGGFDLFSLFKKKEEKKINSLVNRCCPF